MLPRAQIKPAIPAASKQRCSPNLTNTLTEETRKPLEDHPPDATGYPAYPVFRFHDFFHEVDNRGEKNQTHYESDRIANERLLHHGVKKIDRCLR